MSLEKRQMIQTEVEGMHMRTGIAVKLLASFAGVSKSTWQEWKKRTGEPTKHNGNLPKYHWLTPAEQTAIISYCKERFEHGYRRLTYMMIDENIAAASCSAVYNTLKKADLTKKWVSKPDDAKKGFEQPTKIHEHWHTDFSYIKVAGNFYYFAAVLDGFSRMILSWGLFCSMETWTVETVVQEAKELYPLAKPRLITDNGSQFISQDFKELTTLLEMEHTFISSGHPQSNGKLERFHRTLKTEEVRTSAYLNYEDAKKRLSKWIQYYNKIRLHSALSYLTPNDVFEGKTTERLTERREKIHAAIISRKSFWKNYETYSTL